MPPQRSGWHRKRQTPADVARTRQYAGTQHKTTRAAAIAELNRRGSMPCARNCGLPILPGQRLHLDHTDDRTGYLGLTHAACNLKAAARKGARIANARRRVTRTTSRRW